MIVLHRQVLAMLLRQLNGDMEKKLVLQENKFRLYLLITAHKLLQGKIQTRRLVQLTVMIHPRLALLHGA